MKIPEPPALESFVNALVKASVEQAHLTPRTCADVKEVFAAGIQGVADFLGMNENFLQEPQVDEDLRAEIMFGSAPNT